MANKQLCLPANRLFNNSNLMATGGTASLYITGTLTPANFLDSEGTSLGSTLTANGLGQLPDAYQDENTAFRLILKDKNGVELDGGDIDPFYFGLVAGIDTAAGNFRNVKGYGAKGDGTTDDTVAIQAGVTAINALGGGTLYFPEGNYKATGLTDCDNLKLLGPAAVITSASTGAAATLAISHSNVSVEGIHFKLTGGSANPWHIDVTGTNCTLTRVFLEKDDPTGGVQMYVRYGADGFRADNLRLKGSNGVFVEASNTTFNSPYCVARTDGGGDDCIVYKASQGVTETGRIIGGYYEGFAAAVSWGSEIGTAAANDSSYSKIARGFECIGLIAKNCTRLFYIKPGGTDGVDYRDGTLRGLRLSGTLIDASGTAMNQGCLISVGRGARVFDLKADITIMGRTKTGASNPFGFYGLMRNDGVGTANPAIDDLEINVRVVDPYNGVASGGSAPGSPFSSAVVLEKASSGVGTASNIVLDVVANGTLNSGIDIEAGLDNAVLIRRARLTNIDNDGSSTFGGIQTASAVAVGTDISMAMASGSSGAQYVTNGSGSVTPQLPKMLAANSIVGNATGAQANATAITCTAAGRALIDDADAAAQRTTLGLGTAATQSTGTFAQVANNLSDIASASTALTNLGGLAAANNLSDLGSVATARANLGLLTVTSQSGTAYTGVLSDAFGFIRFTNASATVFTVPPNSSVAYPVGAEIYIAQIGAGALSVAAGAGVTINSPGGVLSLSGQYSVAMLKKTASPDTWILTGDLTGGGGSSGTTTNALTVTTSGGASAPATFDGSAAKTIDYSTVGAAKTGAVTGSGLTASATDKIVGRSSAGSGALEEITCTAAGRALIDDADAAAQRTTLGLASVASVGVQPAYVSGRYYAPPINGLTIAASGAITANVARFYPVWFPRAVTVDTLAGRVATTGTTLQLAYYNDNSGRPGTLICATGNIAATLATNVSGAAAGTIGPGLVWMGVNSDNSSLVMTSPSTACVGGSALVGSTTLNNLLTGSVNDALIVTTPLTFGTWGDLTSATWTETNVGSALVFFKAA